MRLLSPTAHRRLNEVVGLLLLLAGIGLGLSFESYSPTDPSWNTASSSSPQNLLGYPGAYTADFAFQLLGVAAFALPVLLLMLGWRWVRSEPVGGTKLVGAALLVTCLSAGLSVYRFSYLWKHTIEVGGVVGRLLADLLLQALNLTGALLVIAAAAVLSLYLLTTFSLAGFAAWVATHFKFLARWRA